MDQLIIEENRLLKEQVKYWQDQACGFDVTFDNAEVNVFAGQYVLVFVLGTIFGALVVALAK